MIFLDVELPDIDGLEVCKLLNENPKTADIPVIMLTASEEVTVRLQSPGLETLNSIPRNLFSIPMFLKTLRELGILSEPCPPAPHRRVP